VTWRRWTYGNDDRTLRDVFSPTAIGVTIVLAVVLIGLGLWR